MTPTKIITLPSLDLSAAVVAVRTSDLLRKELEIKDAQEPFWTGAKFVLGYISNEARRFHIIVANCLQQIKESTSSDQWRYLTSNDNPLHHSTRGANIKELLGSNWFSGPDFLWCDELPSGDIKVGDITVEDPEVCNVFVHVFVCCINKLTT